MSGKRCFDSISEIEQEEGSADVHFAVKVLSHVRGPKLELSTLTELPVMVKQT